MGRKDRERYYVGLHQQAHNKLVGMLAIGESRDEGKRTGEDREKIYSYGTFKTYRRAVMRFIKYVNEQHPECTSLKKAKPYINEWLAMRRDNGASAWTLSMEACALAKLYGIPPDSDLRFHAPPRRREDIRRSRVDAKRDRHFSLTNNAELIRFACATGCRRNVLERLRGDDLWSRERMLNRFAELESKNELREDEYLQLRLIRETLEMFPDMEYWIYHRRDKGGRSRYAPVRPDLQDVVLWRMQGIAPDALVFQTVHSAADIHHYRGEYAKWLYLHYTRPLEEIPYDRVNAGTGKRYQSEVYCCKGDEAGRRLDRAALKKVSYSLGHTRVTVVPRNYLYGM